LPEAEHPTREDAAEASASLDAISRVGARDNSHAVPWLAVSEPQYGTGIAAPVDAGMAQRLWPSEARVAAFEIAALARIRVAQQVAEPRERLVKRCRRRTATDR
jgi:hypothetical protein